MAQVLMSSLFKLSLSVFLCVFCAAGNVSFILLMKIL